MQQRTLRHAFKSNLFDTFFETSEDGSCPSPSRWVPRLPCALTDRWSCRRSIRGTSRSRPTPGSESSTSPVRTSTTTSTTAWASVASAATEPERFDYDAYLDFLEAHGHNFIRLWRWEQFQGHLTPADVHFCMTPQPWARIGPGRGEGRQARVRPVTVRRGVLRASARSRRRGGRARHLRVGDVLRGLQPPSHRSARQRRGTSVPRAQQRQRHRDRLDRRLPGAAARPADSSVAGDLHPQGRRHRARPPERALRSCERVVGHGRRLGGDARRHRHRHSDR